MTFVEEEPTIGTLRGWVEVKRGGPELTDYELYFAGLDEKRIGGPIATYPDTVTDLRFRIEAKIPQGASRLLAIRRNAAGEAKQGATTWIEDAVRVDVGVTSGANPTQGSVIKYDASRNQTVAVAFRDSSAIGVYRCSADAKSCTWSGSVSTTPLRLQQLSLEIDETTGTVFTAAASPDYLGTPIVFRCPPSGPPCISTQLGVPTRNTYEPALLLDRQSSKLVVMAEQAGHLAAWRCDLDATNCTESDVSTPTGKPPTTALGWTNVRLALDEASDTVIAATQGGLFLCARDLSACSYADYRGGRYIEGTGSELAIERANRKIVLTSLARVGTASTETWFFRCNIDGSGCSGTKAPSLAPGYQIAEAAPWIDETANKTLIFAADNALRTIALRCENDFTGCTPAFLAHDLRLLGLTTPAYVPGTKQFVMLTQGDIVPVLLKFGWSPP